MTDLREYDVVVVGGGLSGLCAAIAAARHGARAALIQDRPVLGGNASSEIRMHICGADCGGNRKHARETGILEELILENKKRNPQQSFSLFDTLLWEKVRFQEGLDLFLNTSMTDVRTDGDRVSEISAYQLTSERSYVFKAPIFVDATGDGALAFKAGADCRMGREARDEFQEAHAPDKADSFMMGSTLMYRATDMGRPVKFEKPFWAYTFTEEDLKHREHTSYKSDMELYSIDAGYWWIELGGDMDTVSDAEEIRDELLKTVYGVWDHIKNGGDHGAENYALEWVQFLPGKRESRRILGDYILTENDVSEARLFEDAVAYGGWPMDLHTPGGFKAKDKPTHFIPVNDIYSIPYRCYYSRNVKNLMMAGRNISATHMAFSSSRVMGTCAAGGQAVGTAAAMAVRCGCLPSDINGHMDELQQLLLRDDCHIPGVKNSDAEDLARDCAVEASSSLKGCGPEKVINGVSRQVGEEGNCWVSDGLSADGEWISLKLPGERKISEIHLKLDSDLSRSRNLILSLDKAIRESQDGSLPPQLVRDYEIVILKQNVAVFRQEVRENHLRFQKHPLPPDTLGDEVRLIIRNTHGDPNARVFEIRLY